MAREDTRSPRSSPSKCQRTLEPAPTDEGEPSRKKAAATGDGGGGSCSSGSPSLCCGICLSSAGEKSIRGMIDCCDHYFCFICIREWAKVESRCPMCKRRFSSILRPAIEGVFDTERVVDVPLRDQVYDPLGIRTIDPYAESKCTICKGSQDEWLLLLCDLCDSASHTYCVGLGYTVPTGDWLCPDCNILRKSQADGEESDEARSSLLLSIVREGSSSEINGPVTPASPPLNPSCSVSNGEGRALPTRESKVPLFGARTRHQCRDVHSRIQALRENWNALRRGSVSFSSGPAESVIKKNSQKQSERLPKEHDRLGKASSSGSQQLTDKGGEKSAFSSHYKVPYDVSKAWRMMDLAKSRRQGRNSMMTVQHAAKDLIMKGNASERGGSVHQNPSQSSNYCIVGEQKQERRTFKSGDHSVKGGAARFPPERLNLPDLRTIPVRSGNGLGASRDIDHGMIYSGTSGEGSSRAPSLKSEIQSLVRQNLKMLMRGKQLGVNAFKEIARASTHHVLAACGLEHSKSIQYSSFPSPVCPHLDQAKLQHEAGPMPNACRECFDAFVKNVVGLIMQEKVDRVRFSFVNRFYSTCPGGTTARPRF
ncbi:uncharacterized protein LOC116213867 [Punica granatum]|uniref:Uncharacterized protein LOC116213867 n=1 Tax=Punica granatum TaxID=22663 RepID=A0A6P8EHC3_PUNGR|nr:uncharacterized protein LOC116213867 [Punica granatum]